jgi:hypothetical protein
MKDMHQGEIFHGYTMLNLEENKTAKVLTGSYFTNRKSAQTRGGIKLQWISFQLSHKFE